MDSLTQIVTGGIIGEKILGKQMGNKSILWGAIIGTLPDLDVFLMPFVGEVEGLFLHRGFSHSLLFCLVMGTLLSLGLKKLYSRKKIPWKRWWLYSSSILFGAVFIDYLTTYGASIFWPISSYRIELNTIAIVDLFFTLPALVMVIIFLFKKAENRKILRNSAFFYILVYLSLTGINKAYINQHFKESFSKENRIIRMRTSPMPLTNFLWMGLIETEDGIYEGYHSIFDSSAIDFNMLSANHEYLDVYHNNSKVQKLIEFTKDWYIVDKIEDTIYVNDLRFGKPGVSEHAQYVFRFSIRETDDKVHIKQTEQQPDISNKEMREYVKAIVGK